MSEANPSEREEEALLGSCEAADLLGVSYPTFHRRYLKHLPKTRLYPRGPYLFRLQDIKNFSR